MEGGDCGTTFIVDNDNGVVLLIGLIAVIL